jgi:outer membrane autotransporter protein
MLKAASAGQDFSRRTTDAWTARMQEVRDSNASATRGEGWEMWAQALAGGEQLGQTQTFAVGGFNLTHNLSTDSDWRGFQMGGDTKTAGDWMWGFTGGFLQQETRLHADHNSFDLEGWNVGAYAGMAKGAFFLNGLVKGDWFSVDANLHTVPAMGHFDGHSWGAKAEAGFRVGGAKFYAEPIADLAWSSTKLDDANFTAQAASFRFDDAKSLRGSAGLRVGADWATIQPYVGAYWVDEFEGKNRMTMLTGAGCPSCMTIEDRAQGSFGKVDFGFSTKSWGGLEGFLKGESIFGSDASGFTGRLGVRWRW